MEAGRVELTDHEREWIALAIGDALATPGREPDLEDAARLLEARLATILAARGERGYHEGWAVRAGLDDECTCGHSYADHPCGSACGCADG